MASSLISKLHNTKHWFRSIFHRVKNGFPGKNLEIIGVTGTDGKTTTCNLINHIFVKSGYTTGLVSTTKTFLNNKEIDTGLHVTTPDASIIQPLLKKAAKNKIDYLIIESTSHALDQHRLLGCNFKVGVLTNLTPEHLDYHKTMDKYKKAKAKIFKKVDLAVLNKDDENYEFFKNKTNSKAEVVSYSQKGPARFKIIKHNLSPTGTKFVIQSGRKKSNFRTKLIGKYNLSNILAAVAVTRKLGVPWKKIKNAVASFNGVTGRMEAVDHNQPFNIIIDFAHTPNALENALKTLNQVKKEGKIISVLGCAGERDYQKRPQMGKIATKYSDLSIFTAEDPRHEDVNEIINQMTAGTVDENYFTQPDRQKAINLAFSKAEPGDTVVLFGKGHEKSMCFGSEEHPWSEHKAVKKAIEKLEE
jgi:UDP-N-acetylmuramoyl-L-alanyl-D-glutamate--2,6-diaminopimelate ligase